MLIIYPISPRLSTSPFLHLFPHHHHIYSLHSFKALFTCKYRLLSRLHLHCLRLAYFLHALLYYSIASLQLNTLHVTPPSCSASTVNNKALQPTDQADRSQSHTNPYTYSAMRFSFAIIAASLASIVTAQSSSSNPFNIPPGGYLLHAGQDQQFTWKPTTSGTVSLILRTGSNGDLDKGTTIACKLLHARLSIAIQLLPPS